MLRYVVRMMAGVAALALVDSSVALADVCPCTGNLAG